MRSLAALLAAVALAPAGAAADRPAMEASLFGARENLDNGYDDWREAGAQFLLRLDRERGGFLRLRETERYGARDREAAAGVFFALSPGWTGTVEASGASSPAVLPEWSALATLSRALGDGWVASAGLKRTAYATSDVSGATATLERYVGAYRLAWTVFLSRPDGASWSPANRLTATWYGEGLTRVEAGVARGRETEFVPGAGLLTSDVRNATLSAVLGIAPTWGLTLDLEYQRQGDLYTRETIRLGARVLY